VPAAQKTKDSGKEDPVKEITVEARTESIPVVTDFVNEQLEAIGCPIKAQMQIDVAIDELFANIALYAYETQKGTATVQVETVSDPPSVAVTFIDSGIPFDPLTKEDPDTTLSAGERQVGGLGIFLVKKTMDEVTYRYEDGKNILQIRKNLTV